MANVYVRTAPVKSGLYPDLRSIGRLSCAYRTFVFPCSDSVAYCPKIGDFMSIVFFAFMSKYSSFHKTFKR